MLPAILRRSLSRRFIVSAVVVLMAVSASISWVLFHGADIELGINTGTARRPLVAVAGKVTQMPSGDYLAANTLVDTSTCAGSNVIAWNGTAFACAAAGGGSGGGITNSAPANAMMLSDGTNAVTSFLYQSASILTVGDGVTDRSLYWRGGKLQGYSNSGGTLDVQFDPQGVSFLDSATVGGSHSSGTDETLCIGWICDTLPLKGTLDIRTNSNTIDAATANSGGLHVLNTDTVNTGSAAVESWSVSIEGGQVRGTGTGSLTSYGLVIDHPSNAQVDYAFATKRGDVALNQTSGTTYALGPFKPSLLTEIAPTICDTSISPASLTSGASINNYDLTATMNAACRIRLSASATWPPAVITGFLPPASAAGKIWIVDNVGNGPIVLAYNSASSSAGNKIISEGDGSVVLDEWSMGFLYYDSAISAWRFIGGRPEHENNGGRVVTSITCNGTGTADCVSTSCTDTAGTIETNTSATSCTITFATAWTWAPICNVTSRGALTTAMAYTPSASTLVITDSSAFATNNPIDYHCTGPRGVQ